MGAGALRPDLYHRLAMCQLSVPPLRERREDIALLAEHFLARFQGSPGRPKALDASALGALRAHRWPGNVRELQGVVHALVLFVEDDRLTAGHVERELSAAGRSDERTRLVGALEARGWNATAAARMLGVGRTKLYELIRFHGVLRPDAKDGERETVRTECSRSVRARTVVAGAPGP